jgi:hypothetical protein
VQFPDNLAEHAEQNLGIACAEMEAAGEAAEFFFGKRLGVEVRVAADGQAVEKSRDEAFEMAGVGWFVFWRARGHGGIAGDFIERNGYGLAEIHGAVFLTRGNAQKPVTVAEVFIGEADFFGAEEQSDAAGSEALADEARALLQTMNRLLGFARADRGGSNDESAIGDGFGDGFEFLCVGKQRGSAHCGAGLAKRWIVGVDHAKIGKAEVAHSPRGRPNVQRIPRRH